MSGLFISVEFKFDHMLLVFPQHLKGYGGDPRVSMVGGVWGWEIHLCPHVGFLI